MVEATAVRPATVPAQFARALDPVYGQSLTIRPILPEDEDIETAFLDGLSDQTRYNRFLGAGVHPDRAMIHRFTHIDYRTHFALVATTMLGGEEVQVGVARYVAETDRRAEFAIVIADDWQHCGLGAVLMTGIAEAARANGFDEIFGEVFGSNLPMLALMRRLGFVVHRHPDSHELRLVTLDLRPAALA